MKARHARLLLVSVLVAGVGGAATLATMAMGENMLYFYSPTQLSQGAAQPGQAVRVGGLVVSGSLQRGDGLEVRFDLTDNAQSVTVRYTGILPDLFREGQGIVARGSMAGDGRFEAVEVLAKHDEKYMPPEVADALQAARASKQQ